MVKRSEDMFTRFYRIHNVTDRQTDRHHAIPYIGRTYAMHSNSIVRQQLSFCLQLLVSFHNVVNTDLQWFTTASALHCIVVRRMLIRGSIDEFNFIQLVNPLECKGNYSATSNNLKSIHWPLIGGLLYLVQWGGEDCPLLAVPNVTAHTSTLSVPITVLLYNGPFLCGFNVPVKRLRFWLSCCCCNYFCLSLADEQRLSKRLFSVYDYSVAARNDEFERAPVHDDKLDVNVLAIFVQEIRHEVGHWLVRDVAAQYDVSIRAHTRSSAIVNDTRPFPEIMLI